MKHTKKLLLKLLLISALLTQQVYSQQSDDLIKKIENYKENDSIKVEMYIDYCVANTFSISYKNLSYAIKALTISKKINYKTGVIV